MRILFYAGSINVAGLKFGVCIRTSGPASIWGFLNFVLFRMLTNGRFYFSGNSYLEC
jgi:hypothetical protein